jgi:hypothetical protein
MRGKLSVGDTLSEVFSIYGSQAGVLLPLAFWIFLAVAIVDGVTGQNLALLPLVLLVSTIAGTLYQGTVVTLVRDVQDGRRDYSMGELVNAALPFLLPLIAVGILSGIAIAIGFALLIVPGLFLITIWAVLAPAIVIEGRGVFESFGRSRELVRGNGWPVLGALLVAFVIAAVGGLILTGIAEGIADGPLLRIVFSAIAATFTAPIGALVAGVLYFRLLAIEAQAAPPPSPPPAPSVLE